MKKQKNNSIPDIVWTGDDDDFTCRIGDYCLRVEQMNKTYWWWAVDYKKEEIGFDEPAAKTKLEAKLLAELCFARHWHLNNK